MEPVTNRTQVTTPSPAGARPVITTSRTSSEVQTDVTQQQSGQLAQQSVSDEHVKRAVQQANQHVSSGTNESVSFNYAPEVNRLIVQVKDNSTGEVIREIPSKDFVKQQLAVREMIGLLLDKQA